MERYDQLREWMHKNRVTFRWTASKLGTTGTGAAWLLKADRIPVKRYAELIALGFPAELLPGLKIVSVKGTLPSFRFGNRIARRQPESHAKEETGFDYGKSHKNMPRRREMRALRSVC